MSKGLLDDVAKALGLLIAEAKSAEAISWRFWAADADLTDVEAVKAGSRKL